MSKFFLFAVILLCNAAQIAQSWQSTRVYYDSQNRLQYAIDSAKNRIPDFSYAGYKRGEDSIPFIPVVKTLSVVAGDNTAHIQAAIDSMILFPLNAGGFRGAILLDPGIYNVWGTIRLNVSGVIIRGSGNDADSLTSTVIYGRGNEPAQRPVIVAGGGSNTLWRDSVTGTKTNITSDFVQVGSRTFTVANAAPLAVGDNIVIYHPCTTAWLNAVDSGATNGSNPWTVNEQPIVFNRRIIGIGGNEITIDAPVFNHLDRSLAQSFIYKTARQGIKTNIGIENLRVDIETLGGTDENHAWDAIQLAQIEDSWVRNCVMLHFGLSGVQTYTATRLTIENCIARDPVSIIEGGKRYNFNCYAASQLILFKNCTAIKGRHHFVSNGHSYTSGIVFNNCRSENTYSSSEGHRRWSQGLLYDNIVEVSPSTSGTVLGLYNRGDYGTGHGWASVHSVAWNYNAAGRDIIIQKPPTGQNYAIGCSGRKITGLTPPAPFIQPEGFIEGSNQAGLYPQSLYAAQLADRLKPTDTGESLPASEGNNGLIIYPPHPNPFNPVTTITYAIPKDGVVALKVYDILGTEVAVLENELKSAGEYKLTWNAAGLSSGTYFYRLQAGECSRTMKVSLVK